MKLEAAISQRIYDLCRQFDVTPHKLATMAGLPNGTLPSIFYGKSKNPGTRTLLNVCQALNISLFDFFNDPLFKTDDLEESD